MVIKTKRSSGNVFTDLGFPPEEAANLQLRSALIIQLRKRLATLGDTQSEWAELLGVSQPRVSDLLRGKIERFSVDTLIALLGKTGAEVKLTVRNKVGLHLKNIFEASELDRSATTEESSVVQIEGTHKVERPVTLYSLD